MPHHFCRGLTGGRVSLARYPRKPQHLTSFLPVNVLLALLLRDRAKDDVHVLETASLRLGDETKCQSARLISKAGKRDSQREQAHPSNVDGSKGEEDLVAEVGDHVRSDL